MKCKIIAYNAYFTVFIFFIRYKLGAYLQIYYFLRMLPVSKIQIYGRSGAELSATPAPAPQPLTINKFRYYF